jgi:hypothetical protein
MSIKQDGSQKFGPQVASFDSMIVESFSRNLTGERVDLNNGDGEPLGSVTIPGRTEVSLTVQVGASGAQPTSGAEITYGSDTVIVTSSELSEEQADYNRYSVTGYVKINL